MVYYHYESYHLYSLIHLRNVLKEIFNLLVAADRVIYPFSIRYTVLLLVYYVIYYY
jgi:hypothetical protein